VLVYLITYLHSWLGAHKTGNISKMVDDKVKVAINGLYKPGVGKVRPASSVHPARGGSSVLTLNSAWKMYRTMSDRFHAERDFVTY